MRLNKKFVAAGLVLLLVFLAGGMTSVTAQFEEDEFAREIWRLQQQRRALYEQYQDLLLEDADSDALEEVEDEIFALQEEFYELRSEYEREWREELYEEREEEWSQEDYRDRWHDSHHHGSSSRGGRRGVSSRGPADSNFSPGGFHGSFPGIRSPFSGGFGSGNHCW